MFFARQYGVDRVELWEMWWYRRFDGDGIGSNIPSAAKYKHREADILEACDELRLFFFW